MSDNLKNESSIVLLKECDAGVKMAIKSIDDIIHHVSSEKMKEVLEEARKRHVKIKAEIEEMLKNMGEDEKEPNIIATGMAKMKTEIKVSMEDSDNTLADLLTDGCSMGIKSLIRYVNKNEDADESVKKLAEKLIKSEEELLLAIREYL